MTKLLAIAVGGAFGALLRYGASNGVHNLFGRGFPYGTLFVNVMGSLAMGFLYVILLERSILGDEWRAAIQVGLLGAFTTFSTFSIETMLLLESGEPQKALMNVIASIGLCLLAVWIGIVMGRQI